MFMKMNRWIALLILGALAMMLVACGSTTNQPTKKPVETPVVREEAPTSTPTPKPIPSPTPKLEPPPRQEQAPEPETAPVKPGVPSAPASTGKAILVSLPQQWLYAYENGELVFDHAVETGRPELPTPAGSFTVMDKVRDVMFTSPWPEGSPYYYDPTPVSFGLLFKDGGFFLHDASWHELFGPGSNVPHQLADGRWETGSHGCVGMRVLDAERLYTWAPIGTPVIITG